MSPAKHYFDVLWFHLASIYHQIIDDIGRRGEPPVSLWGDFKAGTVKVLSWVDLVSAANLRWRAMHTKVILPDEQGALHIPDMAMISDQNLWVHLHREITSPLIEARAKWMLEQEQIYLEKKRQAIESWMKDPQPEHTPMHRLDRVQRDAMTEIANVSEQVQLSDPRVSDAFPFAEYHTREDRRVRPTHAAMSGFVAVRSWQGWPLAVPPCGFNCRCYLIFVARFEARQRGWLDKHDRPKFELRWPNSLAESNWNDGKFPEWKTPRFWAFPGSKAAA